MPSRRLLSPPTAPPDRTNRLLLPLAGGLTAGFSCLLLLVLCFRRISKKRTAPAAASETESKKSPHRVSYSLLRRATDNFSPSLRLGQGGFGSVYRGDLKKDSVLATSNVAVKVMDSGSLQGEREFQNELLFSSKIDCKYIVSVIGFSSNPSKRRMLLIYNLMENGSLQDCLFHKKSEELRNWDKRFSIALNIARGLEYLHHYCDPPIIHGDIKPSNILLDVGFNAKIGDLGLARFKVEDNLIVEDELKKEDNRSVMEDTESVISVFEEVNNVSPHLEKSPQSVIVRVETSPETVCEMPSPSDGLDKTSVSECNFDKISVESGSKKKKKASVSGKDWWWKQDNNNNTTSADGESSRVKDYVMEWIGNEIKKERPKSDWVGAPSVGKTDKNNNKKNIKKKRQLDWWASLDDEKNTKKKDKRRPAREWWKEEYCEELEKKKKKKNKKHQPQGSISDHDCYYPRDDDEMYADRKKKRSKSRSRSQSRGSKGSIDWWLDGLSGDIPKSGGISSTPSMRGTVCYIAPEYGGGNDVSEKCDVYSFGVLLLVLIAGRRPLEVTGSPMSEFKRANLLSWARNLARAGKLLDLVDQRMVGEYLNREQALMCVTVALLCLQKHPTRRPSMKEVVGILSGDLECPQLPVEFSPSPTGRFPVKSQKKVRDALAIEVHSYSDEQADKILEDLLADCAALGGSNEINNDKGVKKRQRIASSGSGGAYHDNKFVEDSDRKAQKSSHRDIEKQRRLEMSGLYASLLPLEYIKGKRAVTDQLQQAANYINHMQEKIEKMQTRRDKLKKTFAGGAEEPNNKSNVGDVSRNCVKISLCRDSMEILIGISSSNNEESGALSKVFAVLVGRSELNVTSCVSTTRASDGLSLHKIQIEVNDPTSIDLPELQKRLVNVIN